MRVLARIADRMLSVVVPQASAGACCPPDGQEIICYCSGCHTYLKYCHYNCACQYECGACNKANVCC